MFISVTFYLVIIPIDAFFKLDLKQMCQYHKPFVFQCKSSMSLENKLILALHLNVMALSASAHVQMEYIDLSFECVLMKSACSFIIL